MTDDLNLSDKPKYCSSIKEVDISFQHAFNENIRMECQTLFTLQLKHLNIQETAVWKKHLN